LRSWDTAIKEKKIKVNVTLSYEQESAEESSELSCWEFKERIHQIIKVISRISDSICIKEEWHQITLYWL